MKSVVTALLVTAGLINFLPVAGILSADLLASGYGAELRKVVIMDVIALVALTAAALFRSKSAGSA